MLSNKKIQIGLLVCVILGIGASIHLFVYAPLQQEWDTISEEQTKLASEYKQILGTVGGGNTSTTDLPRTVDTAIERVGSRLTEMDTQLVALTEPQRGLQVLEHFDPTRDFIRDILQGVGRVRSLEESSQITRLNVSNRWGVEHNLGEGKFDTGFIAKDKRVRVYPNFRTQSLPRVLSEGGGTVEFFVKPDWDPADTEVKMKLFFMAIGQRVFASMDEVTDVYPEVAQLFFGKQPPFVLENTLSIYKGGGPTLVFEIRDFNTRASRLTAYISDWKQGQWYHVAAVWDGTKGKERQALYINGSNRGNPLGVATSIRDSEDMDYLDDLAPAGGGGGYGGGMMGMGGMGMMGMGGMGGMGMMGMGGMGMGMGMGGMGGMGGGMGRAAMGGQTITGSMVVAPKQLQAVYVGADEKGGYSSEAQMDDLRISGSVRVPSSAGLDKPRSRENDTLLLEPFDNDFADSKNLMLLLRELDLRQKAKSANSAISIREQKAWEYTVFQKALGIDNDLLDDPATDPTLRMVRKIVTLDNILQNVKGISLEDLLTYLEIEIDANDKLYSVSRFLEFAYSLCDIAMKSELGEVSSIFYKGESYSVTDDELRASFDGEMSELQTSIYGEGGMMGGMGGYGMGMGMMGMGGMGMGGMGMGGMGMGGMGMGGMGMGGMGMGGMGMMGGQMTDDMYDEETGELKSKEELAILMMEKQENRKKLAAWRKMETAGEIPEEVIERHNKNLKDTGEDYYIKRAAAVEFQSDFKAFCRFLHRLEYGTSLNTINRLEITSSPDDMLDVTLDIESHHIEESEAEEPVEGDAAVG